MAEPRLGGHPADARLAAAVPGSRNVPTRLSTPDAVIKTGGVPYEGDTVCYVPKKDGGECKGTPTRTGRCIGHERQFQSQQQ